MGLLPPEEGLPPPDDGREVGREFGLPPPDPEDGESGLEFGLPPPEDDESGLEDDDEPKGLPVTVSQYARAQPVTLIVAVPSPSHSLGVENPRPESVQEAAGSRPACPGGAPDPELAGGPLSTPPAAVLPPGHGPRLVLS